MKNKMIRFFSLIIMLSMLFSFNVMAVSAEPEILETEPNVYLFGSGETHEELLGVTYFNGYNENSDMSTDENGSNIDIAPSFIPGPLDLPLRSVVLNTELTKSEMWVCWTETWIVINAYRSSAPFTVQVQEESSVSGTIGFTGGELIKDYLVFTLEYSHKNTVTIQAGTTCPPWTIVAWRPYFVYRRDYYNARVITYYVNILTGQQNSVITTVTGDNKTLTQDAIEVWSATNDDKSVTAPTLQPPSGMPI